MEKLKIELTVEEVNLVLNSLSELPFKITNEIINNIKTQAENQLKPANVETQGVSPQVVLQSAPQL